MREKKFPTGQFNSRFNKKTGEWTDLLHSEKKKKKNKQTLLELNYIRVKNLSIFHTFT